MLKLFKNIRRKLIVTGNLRRYLFYAVGEILLVVIGILIALQINNLNEKKKNDTIAYKYVQRLFVDFKKDTIELNRLNNQSLDYIAKSNEYFQLTYNKNISIDTLIALCKKINFHYQKFYPNDDTYQEILSNGHLEFMPEQIRYSLLDLYRHSRYVNQIDDSNLSTVNLIESEAYMHTDWTQGQNALFENSAFNTETRKLQALLICQNGIQKSREWMSIQQHFYQITKQKIMELINLIEEFLK